MSTSEPRSRVLDRCGVMIFTGATVRRAGGSEVDPPGRVVELVDVERVRVAWACGRIGAEDASRLDVITAAQR